MKKILMMIGAVAMLATSPLMAQEAEADAAAALPAIPAALADVKYVTDARPKDKTVVYFLLRSHSKCGICVQLAPEFVKIHKKMRGKGAELILLNGDVNDEMAAEWAKSVKMTYPVVSPDEKGKVPFSFDFGGQSVATLPFVVAVTADGEKLGQANGPGAAEYVAGWKKLVTEQKKAKASADADTGSDSAAEEEADTEVDDAAEEEPSAPTITDMLSEVEYVTKVKPKKKTFVYFFVRSHSGCGLCKAMVPACISLYKEMKGKGAEIIMLNSDQNTDAAKAWVDSAGITYPVVTPETISAVNVPAGGSGGTPNVVAVTEYGEVLDNESGYKDCPVVIGKWKDLVKQAKKSAREKQAKEKDKKTKKKKSDKKKSKKKKSADAASGDTDSL